MLISNSCLQTYFATTCMVTCWLEYIGGEGCQPFAWDVEYAILVNAHCISDAKRCSVNMGCICACQTACIAASLTSTVHQSLWASLLLQCCCRLDSTSCKYVMGLGHSPHHPQGPQAWHSHLQQSIEGQGDIADAVSHWLMLQSHMSHASQKQC